MTVGEQIDAIVSDDLVLHGWDLALASGWDEGMDRTTSAADAPLQDCCSPRSGASRSRSGDVRPD
jgi:hypothetical protein